MLSTSSSLCRSSYPSMYLSLLPLTPGSQLKRSSTAPHVKPIEIVVDTATLPQPVPPSSASAVSSSSSASTVASPPAGRRNELQDDVLSVQSSSGSWSSNKSGLIRRRSISIHDHSRVHTNESNMFSNHIVMLVLDCIFDLALFDSSCYQH